MATVTIRVGNYQTITGQIQGRLQTFAAKVGDAVQGAGIDCQAEAKRNCPVGTPESTHKKGYIGGRLRASIQYAKLTPYSCKVGTNVYYSRYVEFGTHKMAARPYLFPAYIMARKNLINELKALVA